MSGPRVVLWRHGETDWNAEHRFQGASDVPLNATGLAQAKAAAVRVAALRPTAIWSSPLQRAQATAGELAALTGLEVRTDARLAEVNVGEWEGWTLDRVAEAAPQFRTALDDGVDFRYSATGECISEVAARGMAAVNEIADASGPDDVVVCAVHGMFTRSVTAFLLGGGIKSVGRLGYVLNCAWCVLERTTTGGWRLVAYNVQAA